MTRCQKNSKALRNIGETAELLDVQQHVLRFWETKFKQISPQKSNGRRYYTPKDIEILITIRDLLYKQGYTINGVKQYLANKNQDENIVVDPIIESKNLDYAADNSAELEKILQLLYQSKSKLLSILK